MWDIRRHFFFWLTFRSIPLEASILGMVEMARYRFDSSLAILWRHSSLNTCNFSCDINVVVRVVCRVLWQEVVLRRRMLDLRLWELLRALTKELLGFGIWAIGSVLLAWSVQ